MPILIVLMVIVIVELGGIVWVDYKILCKKIEVQSVSVREVVTKPNNQVESRYRMLKNGLRTDHFVSKDSADYKEIFDTPGLSLLAPDGTVIEGKQ